MRKVAPIDVVVAMIILAIVGSVLGPALAQSRRTQTEARCQSNLRRLAEGIELYMADNNATYPTNLLSAGYGPTWARCIRFKVSSAASKTDQGWLSLFKCPLVPGTGDTINWPRGCVSYVFNISLVDQWKSLVRDPSTLMMVREVDRRVDFLCRPTNVCNGESTTPPNGAFLSDSDPLVGATNGNLHAGGSHILFADGHVRHFAIDHFPPQSWYTTAHCWDGETMQWWNYGPGSSGLVADHLIRTIAITP